jgi:hypothetical protein
MGLIDKRYARLVLNNDALDDTYDELLDVLIDAYSEAVSDYTERQFTPTDDVTYDFRSAGGGTIDLRPYELRALTGVSYYTDTTTPTALGTDEWRAEPRQRTKWGTYLWLAGFPVGRGAWPSGAYTWNDIQVSVTGDWGMETVPATVKLAVAACVDNFFRNSAGAQSQALGALSFSEATQSEEGLEICSAARRLLRPFVRY